MKRMSTPASVRCSTCVRRCATVRALRELVIERLLVLLLAILAGAIYFLKPFPPRHLSMAAGSAGAMAIP